jgi:predicted XRE-type DNA-binding protein
MSGKFRSSSGDVFRDLGFSDAESQDLRLRSDLMIELKTQIVARGQSQREIAAVLGVQQPRVSNLLQGRIEQFSIDALVDMLDRLGRRVEMTVQEKEPLILGGRHDTIRYTLSDAVFGDWSADFLTLSAEIQASSETVDAPQSTPRAASDNQYSLAA